MSARALPARVRAEVERILDAEARRQLADQLDSDPTSATARPDPDQLDGRPDEGAACVQREPVPIRRRVQRDGRPRAA